MTTKYLETIDKHVFEKLPNEFMGFVVATNNIEKDFLDRNGEFYSVSDFLFGELKNHGADVVDCFGLKIWGRERKSNYILNDELLYDILDEQKEPYISNKEKFSNFQEEVAEEEEREEELGKEALID